MSKDNKKDQERQELFKIIWKIAEEKRCAVDGWDFKQYILGTLFYRFISENLVSYIKGDAGEDYAKLSDNTYIETENTQEIIDIDVLNKQIKETVIKVDSLRKDIDKIMKEVER
ncbi:MAG: hypothetical protein Ta2E_01720 [Mycoplasmoidaceae bacterium]|nr:MAG: hypothetical protein Ta2E_01720 [Mycoplasmoidaceae bacterium]